MPDLYDLWRTPFHGNPVGAWALAALAFLVTFTILPMVRGFIGSRRRKWIQAGHQLPTALAIAALLVERTSKLFLFSVALYFGASQLQTLPPRIDHALSDRHRPHLLVSGRPVGDGGRALRDRQARAPRRLGRDALQLHRHHRLHRRHHDLGDGLPARARQPGRRDQAVARGPRHHAASRSRSPCRRCWATCSPRCRSRSTSRSSSGIRCRWTTSAAPWSTSA